MVLTYFLYDFEMVPVAPIITGITLVFTFHIRCISMVRSLHFKSIITRIIIIITTISFMQVIYTYIPETNNVPKEYNVAAILSLLFMVPISLVPVLTL
jgi:hypothetical protein